MDIYQLIGSLGFPIIACIFLFKQNTTLTDRYNETIKNLMETINNNTIAVEKMCTRLDMEYDNQQENCE